IEKLINELLSEERVELLGSPYVPIDPGQLVAEGLEGDVRTQMILGRFSLAGLFTGRGGSSTWLLRSPLGDQAAEVLHEAGIARTIVTDSVVAVPPTSGPVRLGIGDRAPEAVTSGLIDIPDTEAADPELAAAKLMTKALVSSTLSGHQSTS